MFFFVCLFKGKKSYHNVCCLYFTHFSSISNERYKMPATVTAVRHLRRWPVSPFLDDLSHFPEYKKS